MVTKNASAITSADLPVRKVSIFGLKLVIPKDTGCEVEVSHVLKVLHTHDGLQADFQINLTIILQHTHFVGRQKVLQGTIYTEECGDKKVFRPRMKKVEVEEWNPRSETWEKWYEHELSIRSERAILRTIKKAALSDTTLEMFLLGTISKTGLQKYLPQKPVFI